MAWYDYYDGRRVPPYYRYPESSSELAPVTFRKPPYYNFPDSTSKLAPPAFRVPQYYHDFYPPSASELAPVMLLDPRREVIYRQDDPYWDDNYRRYYQLRDPDDSRHGVMPLEQVGSVGEGVVDVTPTGRWYNPDYPNYGPYVGAYLLPPPRPWYSETTQIVEMYVPMCCGKCERKVRKHLQDIEGVESVSANQWTKKVVVVGHNLHPHFLLRRMQRDKPGSVFWSDRPL